MTDEIKILKSNTFEEWRQKTNEISFDAGDASLLDGRLTDQLYAYSNITGSDRSVITGSDSDGKPLTFELLPDAKLDNTSGYIVLRKDTDTSSINASIRPQITQTGGFSATVESIVTIESKPKILISSSTGTFDPSNPILLSGSAAIPANKIDRLISESFNKANVMVKVDGAILPQELSADGFHIPTVTAKIELNSGQLGSTELDHLTEGHIVYQTSDDSIINTYDPTSIDNDTLWYGVVYYANDDFIYIKSFDPNGTFNTSKILRSFNPAGTVSAGAINAYSEIPDNTSTHVEFHSAQTAGLDVTISARNTVYNLNELQDDIGRVEDLGTDSGDLTTAINELETAARGTTSDYTLTTNSGSFKEGINELEDAVRGDKSDYALNTDSSHGLVGAVNELEVAARGDSASYQLDTTSQTFKGAINEHDAELGPISANDMGTVASNVSGAIREHEDHIGNVDITTIAAGNNTITGALVQLHDEIGDVSATNLGTTASNLTAAVKEHEDQIGNVDITTIAAGNNTITGALSQLHTEIGDVDITGVSALDDTLTGAISQLDTDVGALAFTGTGTTLGGGTFSVTSALNALDLELGDTDSYNDGLYGATTIAETLDLLQAGSIKKNTQITNMMRAIDGEFPGTIYINSTTTIPPAFGSGSILVQGSAPSYTFEAEVVSVSVSNNTILVKNIKETGAGFSSNTDLFKQNTTTFISGTKILRMAVVDSTISVNGLDADNVVGALQEITDTQIVAGEGLTGGGPLADNAVIDIDLAVGGGLEFDILAPSAVTLDSNTAWRYYNEVHLIDTSVTPHVAGALQQGSFGSNGVATTPELNNQKFTFDGDVLSLEANTFIHGQNTLADDDGNNIAQSSPTEGGAFIHFNTFVQNTDWADRTITFTGKIDNYNINSRYRVEAFIKYLRKVSDTQYDLGAQTVAILDPNDANTAIDSITNKFNITLDIEGGNNIIPQIGFVVKGINAASGQPAASGDGVEISELDATVSAPAGGGQLSVDNSVVRTGDLTLNASPISQTINSNLTLSSSTTLTIGDSAVLDVSGGTILLGGGGDVDVSFDTAFVKLQSGNETDGVEGSVTHGIKVARSQDAMGLYYSTLVQDPLSVVPLSTQDAEIKWNEGRVEEGNGHRGWQIVGLKETTLNAQNEPVYQSQSSDLVTFYNAKELFNTSSTGGITLSWNAGTEKVLASLANSPLVQKNWAAGDITAGYKLYGSATEVPQIKVDATGRITDVTGQSISSTMTVAADSGNSRGVDLISDTFKIAGTTNEITTTVLADDEAADPEHRDTIQIGLPDNVDISKLEITNTDNVSLSGETLTAALHIAGGLGVEKDVRIRGDLIVDGDNVTLNTSSLEVEDSFVIIANDTTGTPAANKTAGLEINRGDETNVTLRFNEGDPNNATPASRTPARWELSTDGTTYSTIITEANDFDSWTLAAEGTADNQAIANTDTVTFKAGTDIAVARSTNNITYSHGNTSALSGEQGSFDTEETPALLDGSTIKSITVNENGHVTGVNSVNHDDRYMQAFDIRDGADNSKTISQADIFEFAELAGDGASIEIDWQSDDTSPSLSEPIYRLGLKVTNDNKGSDQIIYKNIEVGDTSPADHTYTATGTAVAGSNDATLHFYEGSGISLSIDASNESIKIENTSLGSNENIYKTIQLYHSDNTPAGGTAVTGVQIGENIVASSNTDTLKFKEVRTADNTQGIKLTRINDDTVGIGHADTSTISNVNNSSNTFIQDLTFDTYGHVTGSTSATVSIGNGTLTLAGGTLLHIDAGGSSTFTANQSGNTTITLDHDGVTRTDTADTETLSASDTFTAITGVSTTSEGHLSAAEVTTYTLPADNNTTYSAKSNGGLQLSGTAFQLRGENIPDNANLDSYTATGYYTQITSTHTDHANSNYPIEVAGTLQVINAEKLHSTAMNDQIIQYYYPYASQNKIYYRMKSHNTWTDWRNLAQDNDTVYSLPLATSGARGGVKIGYTESGKNYPVELSSEKMYVNVPWTDSNTVTRVKANGGTLKTGDIIIAASGAASVSQSGSTITINSTDTNTTYTRASFINQACNTNSTVQFAVVRSTGDVIAYYSDDRLKNRIGNIESALDKVNQLNGFTFTHNEESVKLGLDPEGKVRVGVSAQEVEAVLPEAVTDAPINAEHGTDYKTVQYEKMVPLLVEAIKELTEQNKSLRADLEELKSINNK